MLRNQVDNNIFKYIILKIKKLLNFKLFYIKTLFNY